MKSIIQFLVVLGILGVVVTVLVPPQHLAKARQHLTTAVENITNPAKSKKRNISYAAERFAIESRQPLDKALVQFDYSVSKAPRFRVQGRVVSQLPSGHLFITAHLSLRDKPVAVNQTYALFGHPETDKFKENDAIDCFACNLGSATIEMSQGQAPLIAEELIHMPDDPASKPGAWMFDKERTGTSLDRK